MGYGLTWLAARGLDRTAVHHALQLRPSGAREEIAEAEYDGAQLPTGWYLVVAQSDALYGEGGEIGRQLSRGGEVVCCLVEEHVMVSAASCWRDGRMVWRVLHDPEKGLDHLSLEGDLPAGAAAMVTEAQAEAKANTELDHVFDTPCHIAKLVTGYRHDEDIAGAGPDPYEVLEEM